MIEALYKYFNQHAYNISFFSTQQIIFSDNIKDDVIHLGGSESDIPENGAMFVLPSDEIILPFIIVDVQYFQDDIADFLSAIIHELIHVYDAYTIANQFCHGDLKELPRSPLFKAYRIFTEFHANSMANLLAYQYLDILSGQNKSNIAMKEYMSYFTNYCNTISQTESFIAECYNILGKICQLDHYCQTTTPTDSMVYHYCPQLPYSTEQLDLVYQIYFHCQSLCKLQTYSLEDFEVLADLYHELLLHTQH